MTGKEMWYVAPIRPVRTMKQPAIEYPIQTQSHDCHHEIPSTPLIAEDDIIHVFWQGESAVIPEAAFPSTYDVEGIGNPKADEIPRTPLTTLGLNCEEVQR